MCFCPPQDLRNYQYSLPLVEGLRVHMELGNSYIHIPKSKFHEVRVQQHWMFLCHGYVFRIEF